MKRRKKNLVGKKTTNWAVWCDKLYGETPKQFTRNAMPHSKVIMYEKHLAASTSFLKPPPLNILDDLPLFILLNLKQLQSILSHIVVFHFEQPETAANTKEVYLFIQ